jgi:hypothetical protein
VQFRRRGDHDLVAGRGHPAGQRENGQKMTVRREGGEQCLHVLTPIKAYRMVASIKDNGVSEATMRSMAIPAEPASGRPGKLYHLRRSRPKDSAITAASSAGCDKKGE